MVIVAVAQHRRIHLFQVHAHGPGIVGKGPGLTRVKENMSFPRLQIQAQAMLFGQVLPAGGIFHQNPQFHEISSFFSSYHDLQNYATALAPVQPQWYNINRYLPQTYILRK